MLFYFVLLAAVIIDLLIGDPDFITHPVVIIGRLISFLESIVKKLVKKSITEKIAGIIIVLITVSLTYIVTYILVNKVYEFGFYPGLIVHIWLTSTTLAIKGLKNAGSKVYEFLKNEKTEEAKKAVGRVVGRDTKNMSVEDIIRACVETIAENTSDGITAPLFFYIIGGVPLAMTYKAVNTLDSMLGYNNQKYKHLGWAAARLDDIANFIPARLTGAGFCLAALIVRQDWVMGWKIMLRDAGKHPSWNAGYPEASVAGILGVRLGGLNYYNGNPGFREYLGEKIKDFEIHDILLVLKLMYWNYFILLIFLLLIRILFINLLS